jgi:hypothetical protein
LDEHHGVTSWHRLAKLGGQRSIFAPTIGFAGLLCVLSGQRELLGADGTWV